MPTLILALWGGAYVWSCLSALSGGGVPIHYTHVTPAGQLDIRVGSLTYDPDLGTGTLRNLEIRDSRGTVLLLAQSASVSGVGFNDLRNQLPIRVVARGVFAYVERDATGKLTFLKYVPEPTEAVKGPPISFEVSEARLAFSDNYSKTIWNRTVATKKVIVDVSGDYWGASLREPKIGADVPQGDIHLRGSSSGLQITGALNQTDVMPFVSHIAETPDRSSIEWLRDFDADSLVVSGPVQVDVATKGPVTFLGQLDVRATRIRYGEYSAEGATFKGVVSADGLAGAVQAKQQATAVSGTIEVGWSDAFSAFGRAEILAGSVAQLPAWLRRLVPKDLKFRNGRYSGAFAATDDDLTLDGDLQAGQLVFGNEKFNRISGRVRTSLNKASFWVEQSDWMGAPVSGLVSFDLKTGQLSGGVRAATRVETVGKRFGLLNVTGPVVVAALVSGSQKKPELRILAQGDLTARQGNRIFPLGNFKAAGTYANDLFLLDRFTLSGQQGHLVSTGSWTPSTDALRLNILADGIPLGAFAENIEGQAAVVGKIGGTAGSPVAIGKLEAFDALLFDQRLPVFQSDVMGNRNGLVANNLRAVKGAGRLFGGVSLEFGTGMIKGKIEGRDIQVSDVLGDEYAGVITLEKGTLGGTLDQPILSGKLLGKNILTHGIRLDEAEATGRIVGKVAEVDEAIISDEGGNVSLAGAYDMRAKSGSFTGELSNFPLGAIASNLHADSSISGRASGKALVELSSDGLAGLSADGQWLGMRANDVPIGSGSWAITFDGKDWRGSTAIGEIDRFIEVTDLRLTPETKEVSGQLETLNFRLEDLFGVSRRYLFKKQEEQSELLSGLEGLSGLLTTSVQVSGTLDDPIVSAEKVDLTALSLNGDASGTIQASARREKGKWTIPSLVWNGGPADFKANGTIEEQGELNLDGEIRNVNTKWLANIDPRLGRFVGEADVSFSAAGATASPEIRASFSYRQAVSESKADDRQIDMLLGIREGAISAEGSYYVDGFSGNLSLNVPFKYPFQILTDQEVTGFIGLPNRNLKDLVTAFPSLDAAKTDGNITGRLNIGGRWGDLKLTGQVLLNAPRISVSGWQTDLTSLTASATIANNRLTIVSSADSDKGGSLALRNLTADLGRIEDYLNQSLEAMLDIPISGSFEANSLHIIQKQPRQSEVDVYADGEIVVSGTARSPLLTSVKPIQVISADVLLPSEFASGTARQPLVVTPRFDLGVILSNPARFRAGSGDFRLTGGAALRGDLNAPDLRADLEVEKGIISLPNAKITLDSGGIITLIYKGARFGDSNVRADVDLQGRTGITAPTFGQDGVERYTVFLDIKGNILTEGGLKLTAQSDPPGLSQEQILNILGQGEILGGRGSDRQSLPLQQQLQNALTQIALPAFLDSYTTQFAQRVGLDYFAFEYNTFERITVTAAKYLGSGFSLVFRRQLSEPLPGEVAKFDLRLSYRPRFTRGQFRRISFSVGMDQDRPWKISMEYSFRF